MKQETLKIALWKDGKGIRLFDGRQGVEIIADCRNEKRCEFERTFVLLYSDSHDNDFDAVIDQGWKVANSIIKLMGLDARLGLREVIEQAFDVVKRDCAYNWRYVASELKERGYDVIVYEV